MKLIAAPNALKGSLTARAAAEAIADGAWRARADLEVLELPVADGGDGTRDVLVTALGGEEQAIVARDPLGRPLPALFGLLDAGQTGVVDVATVSGVSLLREVERDPLLASSFGTGELVAAAIAAGARRIVLGLGGSATVDGGMGLLSALGVQFFDVDGKLVMPGGRGLAGVARCDVSQVSDAVRAARFVALCDVDNALTGPDGAALVFAPQKGANAAQTKELALGLERLAAVLEESSSRDVRTLARGGAAGGIAAALHALFGAELVSGIDFVLDACAFDEKLAGASLVITAEGRLDVQSLRNKGPFGVARRARQAGVPTVVLAGSIAAELDLAATPFAAALPIQRELVDLAAAQKHAAEWISATTEQVVRLASLGTAAC